MRFPDGYPLVSSVSPLPTASGETVRRDSSKSGNYSSNARRFSRALDGAARERACEFLRRAHPAKPAEAVEARTGGAISTARVRKWLAGDAAPDFYALIHLIRAYGAEFLVFVIGDAPESLLEAALAERRARYLAGVKKLEDEMQALRR
ncbi:hypothetical protein Ms3S1_14980 [Methylosinus sp. 3S-1]|nr:hypothetical protein A8B73_17595 [Methylosinus sp. 3S-1]